MPRFQFGVQSHHFSVSAFKAILITFSVLAFKAITIAFSVSVFRAITSQIDAQSRVFSFDIQSHHCGILGFDVQIHHHIFVRRSEPPFIHGLRHSESPCHTFSSAFRAITSQYQRSKPSSSHFQFWRSEPSSFSVLAFRAFIVLSFGVQSHHRFSVLAFKAIIILSFGVQTHHHSQFGVQSHHRSQFGFQSHHRSQFGVQSLHHFSVLAFRAIIASQFWHS